MNRHIQLLSKEDYYQKHSTLAEFSKASQKIMSTNQTLRMKFQDNMQSFQDQNISQFQQQSKIHSLVFPGEKSQNREDPQRRDISKYSKFDMRVNNIQNITNRIDDLLSLVKKDKQMRIDKKMKQERRSLQEMKFPLRQILNGRQSLENQKQQQLKIWLEKQHISPLQSRNINYDNIQKSNRSITKLTSKNTSIIKLDQIQEKVPKHRNISPVPSSLRSDYSRQSHTSSYHGKYIPQQKDRSFSRRPKNYLQAPKHSQSNLQILSKTNLKGQMIKWQKGMKIDVKKDSIIENKNLNKIDVLLSDRKRRGPEMQISESIMEESIVKQIKTTPFNYQNQQFIVKQSKSKSKSNINFNSSKNSSPFKGSYSKPQVSINRSIHSSPYKNQNFHQQIHKIQQNSHSKHTQKVSSPQKNSVYQNYKNRKSLNQSPSNFSHSKFAPIAIDESSFERTKQINTTTKLIDQQILRIKNKIQKNQNSNIFVHQKIEERDTLSEQSDVKQVARENTTRLAKHLSKQVQIDAGIKEARQIFNNIEGQNKWYELKAKLAKKGINYNIQELYNLVMMAADEHNPFGAQPSSQLNIDLADLLAQAQINWKKNVCHCVSARQLLNEGFDITDIDLGKKGFISIEDLVCFVNLYSGTFYRNRDLSLVARRIQKGRNRIEFNYFMGVVAQ